MTILERIDYLQRVWKSLLPHLAAPPSEDTARWLNYENEVIEQAILRSSRKFSAAKVPTGFDSAIAWRYTTGTARSIAAAQKETI